MDRCTYLVYLGKEVFNVNRVRKYIRGNEINVRFNSLALSKYFTDILHLPIRKKSQKVDIPDYILESDQNILSSCIRGILDTDFTVKLVKRKRKKPYPVVRGGFASKKLVLSLKKGFEKFNITSCVYDENSYDKRYDKIYRMSVIQISGRKNLEKIMNRINFHNQKHTLKLSKNGLI